MNKKKVVYTNNPEIGKLQIVADFLPSPEELFCAEDRKKVTISLTKRSIDFFKQEAKRHQMQYQKMIRTLLDEYARRNIKGI